MPRPRFITLALIAMGFPLLSHATNATQQWLERFRYESPLVNTDAICEGTIGALPTFTITPPSTGTHFIRTSLPFAPGALPGNLGLTATIGDTTLPIDLRPLTYHPGQPKSIRRGMIAFPYTFDTTAPRTVTLQLAPAAPQTTINVASTGDVWQGVLNEINLRIDRDSVQLRPFDGPAWTASLIAPDASAAEPPTFEVIESGNHFLWVRALIPDPLWPRIIEVQLDCLGTAVIQVHVQRLETGNATAPNLGWTIEGPPEPSEIDTSFTDGESPTIEYAGGWAIAFPVAELDRRGGVRAGNENDRSVTRFLRCDAGESVPMQETAWRRACFVLGRQGFTPRSPLLLPQVDIDIAATAFEPLYPLHNLPSLALWPDLVDLHHYHHDAIVQSMAVGDDAGNVTSFNHGTTHGSYYGMNRLNHNPAIFREAWRSGDTRLRDVAALWCSNMHDLSVWWGDDAFGGTRYNAAIAAGEKEHEGDTNFMWRTNWASHFCTKGYDSFYYAYEETGDPRMLAALRAQVDYANATIHTNTGEARNIGDVADYMNLFRCTGVTMYRDEALRLFRELREKLSPGDLFSQGGQPIVEDGPFIDDDHHGYDAPFAKPYIIGYALAGLPDLLREFPDEPKLRDVVRAVADFMAESQDPIGGWRYPHPSSSYTIVSQGIEHAAQLTRAARVLDDRGEDIANLLDAIERVLQARVNAFTRTGTILSGLAGWERSTGAVNGDTSIYDLYEKPADRDKSRDYSEGDVGIGSAPPEALVYFEEVLAFYLDYLPAERLFHTTDELAAVLARTENTRAESASPAPAPPLGYGMRAHLPHFSEARIQHMTFPLAWHNAAPTMDFPAWRRTAREVYMKTLLERPPLAPFEAETIATEQRDGYMARRIEMNLSADTRVTAYLLVPNGDGPFPAVLALHDHGAHFSIGKEKVIRPFDVSAERMQDAQQWVNECYGGRWFGDELAKRGYVVFATDALFWGDRGRAEGVEYEAQQALAANMFQLGLSWAGTIVWDDIRSAEFVQGLPEVDPRRIACMGLSMGANRTWHLTAASDIVAAGAAICWMGDTPTLMAEGNNQTKGYSAFSMLHPGLRNALDYPHVASIACPKPMLFYNGEQDALFPVEGVNACYESLRQVWDSQQAGGRLETRLWPVPHVFNTEMQEAAFTWLDHWMKPHNQSD